MLKYDVSIGFHWIRKLIFTIFQIFEIMKFLCGGNLLKHYISLNFLQTVNLIFAKHRKFKKYDVPIGFHEFRKLTFTKISDFRKIEIPRFGKYIEDIIFH